MVLGEGSIQLGLQQSGVLPGLARFFLQRLRAEHCVAVPLEHVRFLLGSLHDILHKTTISIEYSMPQGNRLLKVPQRTFIHCSARRIDSKF
jgi:hypothetical protein